MDFEKVKSIVRHVIGGVGAGLVGFGIADSDTIAGVLQQWDALIGAVMFIAAAVTGVINKIKGE